MAEALRVLISPAELKKKQKAEKKLKKRLERLYEEGYTETRIGTTSRFKYNGMADAYHESDLSPSALDLELHGYKEPDRSVKKTVISKARAGLIILEKKSWKDYGDDRLNFLIQKNEKVKPVPEGQHVLIDVMDVSTKVIIKKRKGIPSHHDLLNLSRDVSAENLTQEELDEVFRRDKEYIKKLYSKPFTVIFDVSRGVVSSDQKISNLIKVRYKVKFKGIPEGIIDDAYDNRNVLKVGPRVNLAELVSTHPEFIEKVTVIDLNQPKKKRKKRKLKQTEYYQVTDMVVGGKVDAETMLELLEKSDKGKKEKFRRARANN